MGPRVSALGLGWMRMSSFAGPKSNTDEEGIATIQAALEAGINFLNTGDFCGMGHNELLVGHAIKGRRDQASSRWGDFVPQHGFEGVRSIALPSAALLEADDYRVAGWLHAFPRFQRTTIPESVEKAKCRSF
jgi:Aldo/keto reductase family